MAATSFTRSSNSQESSLLTSLMVTDAAVWNVLAYGLLVAVLLEALIILLEPFQRWRLRHIPGPPAFPIVGCVPQLLRYGSPEFFRQCYDKYGPVFKVALGRSWAVVVADADIMRQVGFRFRNHIIVEPNLMRGTFRRMDRAGLFLAKDDYWRMVRNAWQPAFSPASLSGYLPRMVDCAVQLVERLEKRAAEGGRVNIWRELGSMTLQVVGSTAYGVDFLAMEDAAVATGVTETQQHQSENNDTSAAAAPRTANMAIAAGGAPAGDDAIATITAKATACGRELMRACADVFRYGSPYYGSRYTRAVLLFPEARLLLSLLAHAAPDLPFKKLVAARTRLQTTCLTLIRDWEAKHQKPIASTIPTEHGNATAAEEDIAMRAAVGAVAEPAPPPPPPPAAADQMAAPPTQESRNGWVPGTGAAAKAVDAGGAITSSSAGSRTTAVEPGSFLGLMLSARDKATGEKALSDDEVIAQAQLFILAGYETTANALTFSVYNISTHPEVEKALLSEIDEVLGPDRVPTVDDLPRLPYTEAVFNEALRLYPPAHATTREVTPISTQAGGYTIPAGTPIILAIYTAHRDPRVWPRVNEFIPERFLPDSPLYPEVCSRVPNAHAPFGFGSRMCIGWRFAVQEAKVTLARMYQRLRFELEPGSGPMLLSASLTLAPKDGLWVRPVARRTLQQSHQLRLQ